MRQIAVRSPECVCYSCKRPTRILTWWSRIISPREASAVWVSYWCGVRTVSTVLGAGSAVTQKKPCLDSFLPLNLSLITNSISGLHNV